MSNWFDDMMVKVSINIWHYIALNYDDDAPNVPVSGEWLERPLIDRLYIRLTEAKGLDPDNPLYLRYWRDKLAQGILDAYEAGANDIRSLARAICAADGNDPDKESTGIGALIKRNTTYALWEAWVYPATIGLVVIREDQRWKAGTLIVKRSSWKQNCPLAQFKAIRAGLHGTLDNAAEGINVEGGVKRALAMCEELAELEIFLVRSPYSWEW